MESLFIDDVQQEKTIGRWDSAKRRKMFSVIGVMAVLLVISVIFITLYVLEERRCTPCDAQKGKNKLLKSKLLLCSNLVSLGQGKKLLLPDGERNT